MCNIYSESTFHWLSEDIPVVKFEVDGKVYEKFAKM